MKKSVIILGSTGSIGNSSLKIIKKYKNLYNVELLTTNNNISLLLKQSLMLNVKNVVVKNKIKFKKSKNYEKVFKKNKIKVFFELSKYFEKNKNKVSFTINGISGIEGLKPTLEIIPYTQNIGIANKESLICGWNLILKNLKKYKTNFIPLDSEHFSIHSLIKNYDISSIKNIYLTASGGPFLNKSLSFIKKSKLKEIVKHPNWKMGNKISVDSASMMNKIFEIYEARNIFNIPLSKLKIIIHPKSLIHAIVEFNSGIIKFLIHAPDMQIPIYNFLFKDNQKNLYQSKNFNLYSMNGVNFVKPNTVKFPYLKLLNNKKIQNSYYYIILVTANDTFVQMLIENKISFLLMQKKLIKFMTNSPFTKYFNKKPSNIEDIKSMVYDIKEYIKTKL